MPLPELERKRIESVVRRFCERVPPEARSQIWYTAEVSGNRVALVANRPDYRDAKQTLSSPFARLDYDPKTGLWALKCRDRNLRWHQFPDFEAVPLDAAVAEVEADRTGIFGD